MTHEINKNIIFGYETFREGQVNKRYSDAYVAEVMRTGQNNIVYFCIRDDGSVAYRCWQDTPCEFHVSEQCIADVRTVLKNEHARIRRFVCGACWQSMPVNFIFENIKGFGLRVTDMDELSRTRDKFGIKPVFEQIFNVLSREIPELQSVEKYPENFCI